MKKVFKKIDKPLLFITILLFAIGLVMIFSSSNITAFMKYSASPYRYFIKQLLFLGISFIISIGGIYIHSKSYGLISKILFLLFVPLLGWLLVYGSVKNQAISWIDLGFMSIQPSEFVKVLTIMYLASFYDKNKNKLSNILVVLTPLVIPVVIAALIFLQPDLGTTIIFVSLVAFLFFISPTDKEIKKKVSIASILLVSSIVLILATGGKEILKSRQLQRFDYFNPCSEEKFYSTGNQVCNGYIAINNGGLTGLGLGSSTQKYLYLPEAHTDFIFPIIVEELGLWMIFIIFVLYFLLIGRILKIGREGYNTRGTLICYGVSFYILLHILVNLGGVLGLIPMTGVPLPFMSYGGSYAMCLVMALMLVQRVNVENKLAEEKQKKKKK